MGKRIDIPFREDMRDEAIWNRKFCTTRGEKYGEPGDWFPLTRSIPEYDIYVRKLFVLIDVVRMPLSYVARCLFAAEGLKNPRDFVKIWEEIHPVVGFVPSQRKWVHFFREADEGEIEE